GLQRGALGEGHLHDILVRLTGADHSGVRPHRNPPPLPLLDHFGVGLPDENSDPSERLAPPVTQLLDSRIYQLRGRVACFSLFRAALPLLHGCCRLLSLARHLSILAHPLRNQVGTPGTLLHWHRDAGGARQPRAPAPLPRSDGPRVCAPARRRHARPRCADVDRTLLAAVPRDVRGGEVPSTGVCTPVGCPSLGSFSARFTQLVGETPTAYRARDHSALASVPGCIAKDLTPRSQKPSRIGETRGALAP